MEKVYLAGQRRPGMTPEEMRDKAVEIFNKQKMLCSQMVVNAGLEFIGPRISLERDLNFLNGF